MRLCAFQPEIPRKPPPGRPSGAKSARRPSRGACGEGAMARSAGGFAGAAIEVFR